MKLGKLIELYKAEQEGKTIIKRTYYNGYFSQRHEDEIITLADCEISDFLENSSSDEYITHDYFVNE